MCSQLIAHFRKYIEINKEEEFIINSYFDNQRYAKKTDLLAQDSLCRYHYFIAQGCVRLFFINTKGVEQTIQFAIENWWITDYFAFDAQKRSDFIIQAVENTEVFYISYANQEKLLQLYPQLERYFRLIYQRAYAAMQLRSKYLNEFSREQFYHHFNDNFPEFTKRIPQHLIASYLNMTPEYLSEIKKKSFS